MGTDTGSPYEQVPDTVTTADVCTSTALSCGHTVV
jgi:hypothetical protein